MITVDLTPAKYNMIKNTIKYDKVMINPSNLFKQGLIYRYDFSCGDYYIGQTSQILASRITSAFKTAKYPGNSKRSKFSKRLFEAENNNEIIRITVLKEIKRKKYEKIEDYRIRLIEEENKELKNALIENISTLNNNKII